MKKGLERFEHYLTKLDELLAAASADSDPAAWLYQNGARTPIFMLEGLAKLYSGIHNKQRFAKIREHFKLLEDGLGTIDYYDNFAKQFGTEKRMAKAAAFARCRAEESTAKLNETLVAKKWLKGSAGRVSKIRHQLGKADWLSEKDEVKAINLVYAESIKSITKFAHKFGDGFTDLESQVHELRRQIRWLSIYPQALQGTIQLTRASSRDKHVKKYLTPEITGSPFNKMPDAVDHKYVLIFEKDHFLALSWMIAELGRLKDLGLRLVILKEAGITAKTDAAAEAKILADASDVCRTFFKEKNLDRLVNGVVRVQVKPK